jgi:multicomponent Na+:H+ antiporter subunit A
MTLLVLLFLTLILVPATAAIHRVAGRDTGWFAGIALLALGATTLPWLGTVAESEELTEHLPWIPTVDVGISLRLDGLSMVFLLLVLFIGALVMAYSSRYFGPGKKTGDYYLWMMLFVFSMTGMVIADDLILLFVFWEFTTLCSFFLINRSGPKAPPAAQRTLLITMAGGLALLTAVLMIIVRTGTTELSTALTHEVWSQDTTFVTVTAVLIAMAAFTKSAQFPFHWWLPDAMVAPAPVSAYLHAAAMVKAGIYLLLRFSPVFADAAVWQVLLIAGGLTTALMGALFALQRHDIKEIMAYSTVSQLGFLVAVIGIGTPTALAAATIHVIAHALFKSALFMMVGIIEHESGSRDIRELTGLSQRMRLSLVITVLASLSMAGVPPLLGFVSKEHLLTGFLSAELSPGLTWFLAGLAVLAAAGTFAYCGRIVLGVFSSYTGAGPRDQQRVPRSPESAHEAPWSFAVSAFIPAIAGLLLGFVPGVFDALVSASATASAGAEYEAHFALWHGITPELALSGVIIAAGLVLVAARGRVDAILPRRILPFTGVDVAERARTGSIDLGRRVGDITRSDVHGMHLAAPGIFLACIAVAGVSVGPALGSLDPGHTRAADWVLNGLLFAFLLGAVLSRNRAAAVVLSGGAGFVVGAWFFALGAVDVAMTQLLVEMLTVVVLVLVLRKLPRRFHKVSRSRTAVSAVVALSFGVMAFLATFALTGRRGQSPAAEYYLENTYDITHATNIVNSILVDFRALDTFGELTELGVAGFAILALLNSAFSTSDNAVPSAQRWIGTPIDDPADNTVAMRSVFNWMAPFIVLLSLMLLVRGHYESGGGFIAALVAGGFFALRYLVAPSDSAVKLRFDYALVIVGGIAVGAVTGLAGLIEGSFLRPILIDIPLPWGGSYLFTTALVFDVGIYLAVIGSVLVALDRLGQSQRYPAELLKAHLKSKGASTGEIAELKVPAEYPADPGDVPLQARHPDGGGYDRSWSLRRRSGRGAKASSGRGSRQQTPGQQEGGNGS